jgi:hypothetical protein
VPVILERSEGSLRESGFRMAAEFKRGFPRRSRMTSAECHRREVTLYIVTVITKVTAVVSENNNCESEE